MSRFVAGAKGRTRAAGTRKGRSGSTGAPFRLSKEADSVLEEAGDLALVVEADHLG
jgi:hypothetical protein